MSYGSDAWAELIAQIRRDPSAEELWYVAGDYLLEHGDERGEYIVLCGKLERGVDSGYVEMYERRAELRVMRRWVRAQIARGFPDYAEGSFSDKRRIASTFIERLEVEDHHMLARLPELCRLEPITELICRGLDPVPPAALAMEALHDIITIDLDAASWSLLASPQLSNVRRLRAEAFHDAQAWALAASVVRPHYLDIDVLADVAAFELLAETRALDELRKLPVDDDRCIAALGEHALPALTELDMRSLSSPSIDRLSRNFGQLERATVTSAAVPLIIERAHGGRLRELTLVDPGQDVALTNELIDSAACLRVEKLAMRGVAFAAVENALRRLAVHGHLKELTIDGGRPVRIEGVRVIAAH